MGGVEEGDSEKDGERGNVGYKRNSKMGGWSE
jgi:hypothetical protein